MQNLGYVSRFTWTWDWDWDWGLVLGITGLFILVVIISRSLTFLICITCNLFIQLKTKFSKKESIETHRNK